MTATAPPDLAPFLVSYAALPEAMRHLDPLWDRLGECGTEADWCALLDAHPDHHDARARFALWLRDRGDERADGYAALAACKRMPFKDETGDWLWWNADEYTTFASPDLPGEWWWLLKPERTWVNINYPTRAAAETAAALAFLKLPADRRARLLKGEM